jgi:hypothetical protein
VNTREERDIRDVVWELCQQLADYLERLEGLTLYRPPPHGGPARPRRPALIPEPYGQAGRVLMTVREGVRRLEASLRREVLGHAGRRRGGSDANTADALAMIGKLASRAADRPARNAARLLHRWVYQAQEVDGIDEARRWRHLPRQAGEALPPQCPYCGTFYLLADVEALIIVCSFPGCRDSNGEPPVASMSIDEARRPVLTWGDGRTQAAPDIDVDLETAC